MKKITPFLFVIATVFSLLSNGYAIDYETTDLNKIADETIYLVQETQENGTSVTTYNDINVFFEAAHSLCPAVTDKQLALFVIDYIGQDSSVLSDDELLNILQYKTISTSTSYIKVTEDGECHDISEEDASIMLLDSYTSNDGYMKIETNYAYRKAIGTDKYYGVWATATWLKTPSAALNDVLVLNTTGTFDDSFSESAYVNQTFQCTKLSPCSQSTYRNRSITRTNSKNGDLSFEYANQTPYIKFTLQVPFCDYCSSHSAKSRYITSHVSYGIITSEPCNIQASYGHTTVGLTEIEVTITDQGVEIIPGWGSQVQTYTARAVTVK